MSHSSTLRNLILVTAAFSLNLSAARAQSAKDELHVSDKAKAARDFTFEGMKLGCSLKEFHEKYPRAVPVKNVTDAKIGVVAYYANAEAASGCVYFFLDDKLYDLRIVYDEEALAKIGSKVLMDRLEGKFGLPTDRKTVKDKNGSVTKVMLWWPFPEVDRLVYFDVEEDDDFPVRLFVTDRKATKEIERRKGKTAKTGFDD